MSFLDQLSNAFKNITDDKLSDSEAHDHYDQITNNVPRAQIGSAVGPALSNLGSGDLQQRITDSAAQMNSSQRGDFFGSLLRGLGGAGGNVGGLLSQLGIDPSVQNNPQNASPEDVGKVAAHAQSSSPDVFHKATEFYADHPTLVKALGTAVIAGIARHLVKPS